MSETKKRGKVRHNVNFDPILNRRIEELAANTPPSGISFNLYVNQVMYAHVREMDAEQVLARIRADADRESGRWVELFDAERAEPVQRIRDSHCPQCGSQALSRGEQNMFCLNCGFYPIPYPEQTQRAEAAHER
jgi:hypothetical protein